MTERPVTDALSCAYCAGNAWVDQDGGLLYTSDASGVRLACPDCAKSKRLPIAFRRTPSGMPMATTRPRSKRKT